MNWCFTLASVFSSFVSFEDVSLWVAFDYKSSRCRIIFFLQYLYFHYENLVPLHVQLNSAFQILSLIHLQLRLYNVMYVSHFKSFHVFLQIGTNLFLDFIGLPGVMPGLSLLSFHIRVSLFLGFLSCFVYQSVHLFANSTVIIMIVIILI